MRAAGQKINLAQIETRYQRLCREREIRKNITAMQGAGATVKYYSVNVCDEQAFGNLIEEVYRSYGRLDGIIHGAGIIEDKLVADKAPESFDRVYNTKVDSAFVLAKKVKADSLRFLVFFSSVAGRFGNQGQADYVAANEVLNKLAAYLDGQWSGRVVSINWGPWAKTGMVTRHVEKQFAQQGVHLIQPNAGRLMFEKEISLAPKGDIEVTIGQMQNEELEARSSFSDCGPLSRFADRPSNPVTTDHLERIHTLDIKNHLYLEHHQLDGKPVFPMAMAVEMMAETVRQRLPEREIIGVQSLQVLKGIVLNDKARKIRFTARTKRQSSHEEDILEIETEITELERPDISCYRAIVLTGKQFPEASYYEYETLSKLRPFPLTTAEAYERWLFQGPYFQGISVIDGMNDHGISGVLSPSSPYQAFAKSEKDEWIIDPVILDASLQLAILWERAFHDMMPLPARFLRYHRFASTPIAPVHCYVHTKSDLNGHILVTDNYFVDNSGRILGILEQMEFSCTKALKRLSEFPHPVKGGN
jgi:NAD(P)-dependent dehydrogenase (short-subunit alcohol dehydrogenase family)